MACTRSPKGYGSGHTRRPRLAPVLFAAGCFGLMALPACAEAPKDTAPETTASEEDSYTRVDEKGNRCFFVSTIQDFTVIDDEHVVLEGAGRRYYLATLFAPCLSLRFQESIALQSRTTTICERGGEYLVTRDDRCYIDRVEPVESVAAARALVEKRSAEEAPAEPAE